MNSSPVLKRCTVREDKKKVDGSSSSSIPFLLVGRGQNQSQARSLYNLVTQKVCDFEVQLSHDYYCRGSSFGWLVAMKPDFRDDYYYQFHVQLYNPFLPSPSKNIINLPPLFNILEIKQMDFSDSGIFETIYDRDLAYLLKAVLSCNPMLNSNFAVMAILGSASKLAFYTPALKDWTPINWERKDLSFFTDVIYSNMTQQFYVVKSSGEVLAIDLIPDQDHVILPKITQVTPPIPEFGPSHKYIVETSSGDLLQVLKTGRASGSDWDGDLTRTFDFTVLKFDPLSVTWSRIHDMGDTILFLGDNSSLSRSSSDFPGCKPNCIYYTDDVHVAPHAGMQYLPQDMAIYNLADGTHQPHYPTTSTNLFPAPIWLEPTVQW